MNPNMNSNMNPGMGYGGQPGNFNMVQSNSQFPRMPLQQQPQQYRMMPGPNPMMPQGNVMMAGQRPAYPMYMNPGQMNQAGYPGMMPMPGQFPGQRMASPPAYTPKMAQEFKTKQEQQQKLMADQQKKMEQALKERHFLEQKQRLKEMSTIGTRHVNADSLIESIIGKPEPRQVRPVKPAQPTHQPVQQSHQPVQQAQQLQPALQTQHPVQQAQHPVQPTDDFGDFITGPANPMAGQTTSAGQLASTPPVHQTALANQIASTPPAVDQLVPHTSGRVAGQNQAAEPSNTERVSEPEGKLPPKDGKKDLMSMMFECSDFTAPNKAKGFIKKTSLKDLQPSKVRTVAYHTSEKARRWGDSLEDEKFSEIFTLPVAQHEPSPPNEAKPPKWLTGEVPVPDLYRQVLEASSREGKIETELVYPILMRSGLPREVLGQIWSLCNRKIPGQLHPQELFMILGLVTVAQNKMNYSSLDILLKCPQAPIPNLGQTGPPGDGEQQAGPSVQSAPPVEATPAGAVLDTGLVSPQVPVVQISAQHSQGQSLAQSPQDDDFADFQAAPTLTGSASFGDFTSATSGTVPLTEPQPPKKNQSTTDLMGPEDKYAALKVEPSAQDDFADFQSSSAVPVATPTPSQLKTQSPQIASSLSTPAPSNTAISSTDFANFSPPKSQLSDWGQPDDGFADFQTASDSRSGDISDKLSSLKALVMDKSLFSEKPIETKSGLPIDKDADLNQEVTEEKPVEPASDDWADFESAPQSVPVSLPEPVQELSTVDWLAPKVTSPPATLKPSQPTQGASDQLKPKPPVSKAHGKGSMFFARNLDVGGVVAGTGMSPLDTMPPDMPDMHENEDPDDFDHFGTFQSNATEGISSLGTPYGGLDDFGDFSSHAGSTLGADLAQSQMKPSASKDTIDTQSTSSMEFTGWKNPSKSGKDDSQSMHSLDFKHHGSKEGTPTGGDSQSVSSLELAAGDSGQKTGTVPDETSVASLELKAGDATDVPGGTVDGSSVLESQTKEEPEGFGEFSVPVTPIRSDYVQSPVDASEILRQGELPNLGDRYSGLTQEPEEGDKHIYEWQRLLEKALEMVKQASRTMASLSGPSVRKEVMESEKGSEHLRGVVEIYRVVQRVRMAMKGASVSNTKLHDLLSEVDICWKKLTAFINSSSIMPDAPSLNFSQCVVSAKDPGAQDKACGVCLLNVDGRSMSLSNKNDGHKLSYGDRHYHASCANFWVNCVDLMLPKLKIPELL